MIDTDLSYCCSVVNGIRFLVSAQFKERYNADTTVSNESIIGTNKVVQEI